MNTTQHQDFARHILLHVLGHVGVPRSAVDTGGEVDVGPVLGATMMAAAATVSAGALRLGRVAEDRDLSQLLDLLQQVLSPFMRLSGLGHLGEIEEGSVAMQSAVHGT